MRCINLILQSYLKHLPLSGGHVYPPVLFKFISICDSFVKNSKISTNLIEDLENLKEDSERLSTAAKSFEKKFAEVSNNIFQYEKGLNKTPKSPRKSGAKRPNSRLNINVINNLAKERFGTPKGSKAANLLAHKKKESLKVPMKEIQADHSEQLNSTLVDGISLSSKNSLGISVPKIMKNTPVLSEEVSMKSKAKSVTLSNEKLKSFKGTEKSDLTEHRPDTTFKENGQITVENATVFSVRRKSDGTLETLNPTKVNNVDMDTLPQSNSKSSKITESKKLFDQDSCNDNLSLISKRSNYSKQSNLGNHLNFVTVKKKISLLEIEDDELFQIENSRNKRLVTDLKSLPQDILHLNPVDLVNEIADNVVLKIVENICNEAVDQDMIRKLVQAELIAS